MWTSFTAKWRLDWDMGGQPVTSAASCLILSPSAAGASLIGTCLFAFEIKVQRPSCLRPRCYENICGCHPPVFTASSAGPRLYLHQQTPPAMQSTKLHRFMDATSTGSVESTTCQAPPYRTIRPSRLSHVEDRYSINLRAQMRTHRRKLCGCFR